MPRNFARRIQLLKPSFTDSIDAAFPQSVRFHLQEPSGAVALATNTALVLGRELLDESGASGTATAANYTQGNNAALTNPSVGILSVARDGTNNPFAQQAVLTIGKRYKASGEARSDGNAQPRVFVGGVEIGGFTTSTDWQPFDAEITATATNNRYWSQTSTGTEYTEWRNVSIKQTDILASSVYAPGTNPMDAANTALTVAVPAEGNIKYLYSSNATTSVLDLYSEELNSFVDWANIGFDMVALVDTWVAGVDVLLRLAVDDNNEVIIYRSGTDLVWEYRQASTSVTVTLDTTTLPGGSPTNTFTVGLSADVAGVGLQAIYNGAQQGTNQAIAAAIIGNLDSTMAVAFANTTAAANSWAGDGSEIVIHTRTPSLQEHSDYHQGSGL